MSDPNPFEGAVVESDVDQLRDMLDLLANYPNNDQRARYILSSNWMRDRDAALTKPTTNRR